MRISRRRRIARGVGSARGGATMEVEEVEVAEVVEEGVVEVGEVAASARVSCRRFKPSRQRRTSRPPRAACGDAAARSA